MFFDCYSWIWLSAILNFFFVNLTHVLDYENSSKKRVIVGLLSKTKKKGEKSEIKRMSATKFAQLWNN
jgi:hypothetical protein